MQLHDSIKAMSKEPVLATILRWGVYAVAFVPLVIFSQYISPFHFGKIIIFRSLIEIMVALYLVLIWKNRAYLVPQNRILWAVVGFAAVFSLTTATSVLPYASFWGSLERMGGLWTFWHYIFFFVIATSVMRRREEWMVFLKLTIVVGILSAIYGFGQKTDISFFIGSGGRERIFGTIGNAALFAGYEIVNFFLALTLLLARPNSRRDAWLFETAVVFDGLAIIMTVVRGSLLGLGVGLGVFFTWYFIRFRAVWAKRVILVIVAGIAIFGFVVATPIKDSALIKNSRFLSRLTDTSFDAFTAKTRFWAWEAGIKGWQEGPKTIFLGWGPENFNIPFSKYFNPLFFNGPGSETLFDRAHNMFVEILVTMGLIGLVSYLSIFWSFFSSLKQLPNDKEMSVYRIGFTSLIIAYVIHNAFIFDTSANLIVFFTVLAFIASLLWQKKRGDDFVPSPSRPSAFVSSVGILLLAATAVLAWRTNIISAKANYATTRGIVKGWDNKPQEAMVYYKKALAYDVPGKYEYRHRMAQYVLEYTSSKPLNAESIEMLKFTIGEVQKNADENLPDYLPHLYLSRLNIILGKDDPVSPYTDEALKHSARALEISPTFVRTYYEVAQAYLNKKDNATAIKYFQKALDLNPTVGISYWYLGLTMAVNGKAAEGLAIAETGMEKGYYPNEGEYLRLIQGYVDIKNYQRVTVLYEKLVAVVPKKAQYWASLATSYGQIGQIDKAVNAAHKAAELDSAFAAEAQRFVESLGRTW